MDAASLRELKCEIKEKVELIKAERGECKFFIAGDLNRRDITECFVDMPEIKKIETNATRGNAVLDICFSDLVAQVSEIRTLDPLEDDEGNLSDHKICFFSLGEEKIHRYSARTFKARKYTLEGEVEFGRRLNEIDWTFLSGLHPDQAVKEFNYVIKQLNDDCFPETEHKIRSCDKPWVTKRIKRLIRRRKRAFKRSRKGRAWKKKRDIVDRELLLNKQRYLARIKDGIKDSKNPREYYRAIRLLQSDDAPRQWDIGSLFPGASEAETAERAADFFNRISTEFRPVGAPVKTDLSHLAPTTNAIKDKLRKMKKPRSQVEGDIDRRLVVKYGDALSTPLGLIYSSVYREVPWPIDWKTETVTLIPKTKSPDSLAQLRNISCTPFFSKVLESFILDNLKQKVELSSRQFGGKKGQGVDHMLVEIWEEIHKCLEDPAAAVNLMAVDFEKAFNRMDHRACLESLELLGADPPDIMLVNAFLHGRNMSVKVKDTKSRARPVPGGAPQGSILACFLFCATIERLLDTNTAAGGLTRMDSPGPPPDSTTSEESEDTSDDERIDFFRWFNPRRINDTVQSFLADQDEINRFTGSDWASRAPVVKGYIDDFNVVEKINEKDSISHITTGKTTKRIHAPASQSTFEEINRTAGDLGLKVNSSKTQILCISSATTTNSKSYINFEGKRIDSGKNLKILGFNFNEYPSVRHHIEIMLNTARLRLWTLRFLKKSGLDQLDLLHFYKVFVRSILDFAVPTYHPQLSADLSSEIERVQATAMKIIFPLVAYHTVLENQIIEEHQLRRERMVRRFAERAERNEKFGEKWFPPNTEVEYELRNRKRLLEENTRTKRFYQSPIQYMRRLLNQ